MGISPSKIWNSDTDQMSIPVDPNNPLVKKIEKFKEDMTGWDRIKMIFVMDDMGDITPELTRIRDGTLMGFFVGAMFGAVGRSKIAYSEFFRSNYHEAYETPLRAKTVLQEKVTLGMMSGGFRVGWRIGAFTGIYMLTQTCIAQYRNKIGVLDQVGAGGLAGFLYKFKEGPKSMVVGLGLGSSLGLLAGVTSIGLIKLTGLEPEKANIWYYQNIERRKQKQAEIFKTQRDKDREDRKEDDNLMSFHQKFMQPESSFDKIPMSDDESVTAKGSPKESQSENESKTETKAKNDSPEKVDVVTVTKNVDSEKLDTTVKTVNANKVVLNA